MEVKKRRAITRKKESGSGLTKADWKKLDKRFGEIDKKFKSNDKKFISIDNRFENIDKKFENIDIRFENIDKKFEENDKAHDRIYLKLVEHDQKMHTFVTKDEFHDKMDEINGRFDEMMGVLKDIRQEQAAFVLWSSRHEEKIEVHDRDIKKIKQRINIS